MKYEQAKSRFVGQLSHL